GGTHTRCYDALLAVVNRRAKGQVNANNDVDDPLTHCKENLVKSTDRKPAKLLGPHYSRTATVLNEESNLFVSPLIALPRPFHPVAEEVRHQNWNWKLDETQISCLLR
ncbi:hypothetical protein E4U10_007160, partial [Claviceps purpurea]